MPPTFVPPNIAAVDGVGEVFEYAAFFVRAYHAAYAVCAVDDAGVASAVYAAAS